MGKYLDSIGLSHLIGKIKGALAGKQDTLVSGTNIKTVNNTSLLGSGNISVNAHQTLTDVTANEYVGEDGTWSLYWDGDGETSYIANVPALYGTCNTAASNTTKQVSCGNAAGKTVYEDGTVLNVYFSTANTAAGTIYLKVGQNTGSVYVHGTITGSSNPLLWDASTMLTFVRSGSVWRYVGSDTASPSAQTYTASWVATSSAANNVKLTDSLILPAGTYVVVANLPNTSTWMAVQLYGVDSYYGHGQMLQHGTWIITLTQETEIYLRTASSVSCTYSYTNRGRLTAVRIAGVSTSAVNLDNVTGVLPVEHGGTGDSAPMTQTLATNAILYTWGKSAMLVLNGYKTRYAYVNNDYSPNTKTEFTIPAGYRPAGGAQVYGRFGAIGSTVIVNASNAGIVTFQPNGALSANTSVWGSASWVIA